MERSLLIESPPDGGAAAGGIIMNRPRFRTALALIAIATMAAAGCEPVEQEPTDAEVRELRVCLRASAVWSRRLGLASILPAPAHPCLEEAEENAHR